MHSWKQINITETNKKHLESYLLSYLNSSTYTHTRTQGHGELRLEQGYTSI